MERKTIKVKLEYDFKTMKQYNYYNLFIRRKTIWAYIVPLIIGLGLGTYFAIMGNYLFAIVMGVFALYLLYQIFNMEKVIDNQITKFFLRNPRVVKKEIVITDEEIAVHNPNSDKPLFSYPWEQISEIHDTLEFIFLLAFKNAPIIINKSEEFFLEGTLEELQVIIFEKAQFKPYRVYTKPIGKRPVTFAHQEFDDVVEEDELIENDVLNAEVVENEDASNNEE